MSIKQIKITKPSYQGSILSTLKNRIQAEQREIEQAARAEERKRQQAAQEQERPRQAAIEQQRQEQQRRRIETERIALIQQQEAARQAQLNESARELATVLANTDIPEPLGWAAAGVLGSLALTASFPSGNNDDFEYDFFFNTLTYASMGFMIYAYGLDAEHKYRTLSIISSETSLKDQEEFRVLQGDGKFSGWTISTGKYFGSELDDEGFVIWLDVFSQSSDDTVRYLIENDESSKGAIYESESYKGIEAGLGIWRETSFGLVWSLGAMLVSVATLDDHGLMRSGSIYPDLGPFNSEESNSFLAVLGPWRAELIYDRFNANLTYDWNTGSTSMGLGYTF